MRLSARSPPTRDKQSRQSAEFLRSGRDARTGLGVFRRRSRASRRRPYSPRLFARSARRAFASIAPRRTPPSSADPFSTVKPRPTSGRSRCGMLHGRNRERPDFFPRSSGRWRPMIRGCNPRRRGSLRHSMSRYLPAIHPLFRCSKSRCAAISQLCNEPRRLPSIASRNARRWR